MNRHSGSELLELHAQLAHVHVDRAIAVPQRHAPDVLVEILAPHDPPVLTGEFGEQAELADGQAQRAAAGDGQALARADLEHADLQDVAAPVQAGVTGGFHDVAASRPARRRRVTHP